MLCSRYDCCSGSHRIPSGPLSWFPGFSRCLLAPCASCSFVGVAPSLKIPEIYREFSTATACAISCHFLPWTLSSPPLCTTLCPQQFVPAPCQRASFTCKTDSFLWGHGPDTLACKARPSFDRCGTSLSVSLSLSETASRKVSILYAMLGLTAVKNCLEAARSDLAVFW